MVSVLTICRSVVTEIPERHTARGGGDENFVLSPAKQLSGFVQLPRSVQPASRHGIAVATAVDAHSVEVDRLQAGVFDGEESGFKPAGSYNLLIAKRAAGFEGSDGGLAAGWHERIPVGMPHNATPGRLRQFS